MHITFLALLVAARPIRSLPPTVEARPCRAMLVAAKPAHVNAQQAGLGHGAVQEVLGAAASVAGVARRRVRPAGGHIRVAIPSPRALQGARAAVLAPVVPGMAVQIRSLTLQTAALACVDASARRLAVRRLAHMANVAEGPVADTGRLPSLTCPDSPLTPS